jgi:hypothetical protein
MAKQAVHTIEIDDGKGGKRIGKRTSKTRAYGACVVVTTTEASVAIDAQERAKAEADLAAAEALMAERMERFGMDLLAATAKYEADQEPWYKKYWDVLKACNHNHDRAHKETAALGIPDPWDVNGTYGILDANYKANSARGRLEKPVAVLGSQAVRSWHRDAGLAAKEADSCRGNVNIGTARTGDTFTVRTDITVA